MTSNNAQIDSTKITEGLDGTDLWNPFDSRFVSYVKSSIQLHCVTSKSLFMQILAGYHLQLTHRPTIFSRIVGLYSIRFGTLVSNIEIYVAVMLKAFTPSLQINEIFDLKGSPINRQLEGTLSLDKLHKLKDLDFVNLYPHGIRIPSNIYQ
ncbi:unnamed protein product [Rotaria socialis]|nr:unnamed protein product [Rotaria socialis]CAF4271470.1 unnamed protein product [Rotaria socialis]